MQQVRASKNKRWLWSWQCVRAGCRIDPLEHNTGIVQYNGFTAGRSVHRSRNGCSSNMRLQLWTTQSTNGKAAGCSHGGLESAVGLSEMKGHNYEAEQV